MNRKILVVASTFSHIQRFHLPYLRALHEEGHTIHVACGGAETVVPWTDRTLKVPFEKKMYAPGNFRAAAMLRRAIRAEGYDLIIVHTSLAAFFTRLAVQGMEARPRVVNVVHGYLFDDDTRFLKRTVLLWAERIMAGVTDLLLCMNQWDYALARRRRLGREIGFIPGVGVDMERFPAWDEAQVRALREERGIGEDAFVLLYGAEFSRRKSQQVLIRAMEMLPKRVVLALPGSGELADECRALADSLGLSGRVLFPGEVKRMEPWYAVADAAVSASRSEGLPFNIMEAMCCGLPVVASDVKGNSDLVADGETGLLYPYGDEQAFAAAVEKLLADEALRGRMGEKARRAVDAYSLGQVFPQVMRWYETLL